MKATIMRTPLRILCMLTLSIVLSSSSFAQKKTIELVWPQGAPDAKGDSTGDKPTLSFFFPEKANGTAIVIYPGGAYRGLANHEGDTIAQWCNTFGVTGIVLRYRHARSGA